MLDTAPEPAFDDLTRLAAQLCGTPIALVSLIDEQRQWFKSAFGLSIRETPRSQALCSWTIRSDQPLIVQDASADERFRDNVFVTGAPGIRFYAGVPLVLPEGSRVGSLCVIDTTPRSLSAEQLNGLLALSRQVEAQLRLRRKLRVLADKDRALRESEARYRNVVDSQTELVCRFNEDLVLTFVNEAYCRFFRRAREELLGRSFLTLVPPEHHEQIRSHIRSIPRSGTIVTLEHEVLKPDGSVGWQRWVDRAILDEHGRFMEYQSFGWDITEVRRARHDLEAMNRRLTEVNAQLESRNREIVQLTHAMTHDLQTPIATMTGVVTQLEAELRRVGEPTVLAGIGRIRGSADRLTSMLDDLMVYAKAGAERFHLSVLDAGEALRAAARELAPIADRAGISLRIDAPPAPVRVDRAAFERCLINFLGNAIKFTSAARAARPPGDRNTEETQVLGSVRTADGRVRLEIQDRGPGVAPAHLERVFLPFHRGTTEGRGTGLGLATSRRFIEAFGGRLWIESDGQTGTTAVIELPAPTPARVAQT